MNKLYRFVAFKVPKEYSFVQALDLFYKAHKLFHIPFHNHLQHALGFLGAYIYDIKEDERFLTAKTKKFKHIVDEPQNVEQQSISTCNQGIQTVRRGDRQRDNQSNRNSEFEYSDD